MRKPIFLLLVAFFVPNTLVRADGVDDDVANRLARDATTHSSGDVRLAALKALTELGPKASTAVPVLKTFLSLPNVPPDLKDRKELFIFHTAQALAMMGEKARSTIPELAEAQGKVADPKAKKALASAVVALALAQPGAQTQPQASAKKEKTLTDLINDLKSKDKGDLIAAAKLLGEFTLSGMPDTVAALQSLLAVLENKDRNEDPDVLRLIAQSVKRILKIGTDEQLKGFDAQIKLYVNGLRSMLKIALDKKDANTAIFAAKELGVAAKNLDSVPVEIDLATDPTQDPDVKSTAENARKLIVQALLQPKKKQ